MSFDPWAILDLEPGASEAQIAAARRALAAAHAGDAPACARIDEAFRILRDPRARARDRLLGPRPLAEAGDLVSVLRALPRHPAGAALWLEALRERG